MSDNQQIINEVRQNLESVNLNIANAGFDLSEAVEATAQYMTLHNTSPEAPGITVIIEEIAFGSNFYQQSLGLSGNN